MDVLIADVPSVDLQIFPLGYLLEHPLQLLFNIAVRQHLSAVLGSPNYMIAAVVCAVLELIYLMASGHKITSFPRRLFYLMDKSYAFKRTHQLTLVVYLVNQLPRGKPRGMKSEEAQLSVFRFHTLFFNVFFNDAPVPPLADRGDIISIAPKFPTPEFFL